MLKASKLIAIAKGIEHNRAQTICRITPEGRKRYLEYRAVLEQVIRDAAAAVEAEANGNAVGGLARS